MAESMTAKQLLKQLRAVIKNNPDAADYIISTEGCDCYGDVGAVEVDKSEKLITLYRAGY